ncbi:MAG: hypothetical protein KAJ16_02585, partial [Calditrichia bacterium]|nr:hypothetical protein [Calditrichia bacterium]
IFDYCTQSNSFAGLIELADLHALKYCGNEYNEKYFHIFWFKTKFMTFHQFSNAAEDLASMYYTAWINAGKPNIKYFFFIYTTHDLPQFMHVMVSGVEPYLPNNSCVTLHPSTTLRMTQAQHDIYI